MSYFTSASSSSPQVGTGCSTDWLTIPCATNTNDPFAQNGTPVVCVDRLGQFYNPIKIDILTFGPFGSLSIHFGPFWFILYFVGLFSFTFVNFRPYSLIFVIFCPFRCCDPAPCPQVVWDGLQLRPDVIRVAQCTSLQLLQTF